MTQTATTHNTTRCDPGDQRYLADAPSTRKGTEGIIDGNGNQGVGTGEGTEENMEGNGSQGGGLIIPSVPFFDLATSALRPRPRSTGGGPPVPPAAQ
jgi:hypothetical protein